MVFGICDYGLALVQHTPEKYTPHCKAEKPVSFQVAFTTSGYDFDPCGQVHLWCVFAAPMALALRPLRHVKHARTVFETKCKGYTKVPWLKLIDHLCPRCHNILEQVYVVRVKVLQFLPRQRYNGFCGTMWVVQI